MEPLVTGIASFEDLLTNDDDIFGSNILSPDDLELPDELCGDVVSSSQNSDPLSLSMDEDCLYGDFSLNSPYCDVNNLYGRRTPDPNATSYHQLCHDGSGEGSDSGMSSEGVEANSPIESRKLSFQADRSDSHDSFDQPSPSVDSVSLSSPEQCTMIMQESGTANAMYTCDIKSVNNFNINGLNDTSFIRKTEMISPLPPVTSSTVFSLIQTTSQTVPTLVDSNPTKIEPVLTPSSKPTILYTCTEPWYSQKAAIDTSVGAPIFTGQTILNVRNASQSIPRAALCTTVGNMTMIKTQPSVPLIKPKINADNVPRVRPSVQYGISGNQSKELNGVEDPLLKKQQRMIRNRESASLSRKRRKDQMQLLEAQVSELQTENEMLRKENENLRRRISQFEGEDASYQRLSPSRSFSRITPAKVVKPLPKLVKKPPRGSVILCMLSVGTLLFISSQFFSPEPLGDFSVKTMPIPRSGVQKAASAPRAMRRLVGRTLLWANDTAAGNPFANSTTKTKSCRDTWVNSTESLRLEEELRGWVNQVNIVSGENVFRDEDYKLKGSRENGQRVNPSFYIRRFGQMGSGNALWNAFNVDFDGSQDRVAQRADKRRGDTKLDNPNFQHHVEFYPLYNEIYNEIRGRNDTFYFISFSVDNLVVSASVSNSTFHRPKMSFLMPAPFDNLKNDTNASMDAKTKPGSSKVAMMQIDCEVTNTRIVHLRKASIPKRFRERKPESRKKY